MRQNIIPILIFLSIALMILSAFFTFYNRQVMLHSTEVKLRSEFIQQSMADLHFRGLKSSDLTVRGYALSQTDHYRQLEYVRQVTQQNIDTLEVLLEEEEYSLPEFHAVRDTILAYFDFQEYMMTLADQGRTQRFKELFEKDRGQGIWEFYNTFAQKINTQELEKINSAQDRYQKALNRNIIIQLFLVLIGIPTLITIFMWLRSEKKKRENLLQQLAQNNRNYLFDAGNTLEKQASDTLEQSIIQETTDNLEKAAHFIQEIAQNNYEVNWEGWSDNIAQKNQNSLTGSLHVLRDKLKAVKLKNEQRLWHDRGLSNLSELLRQEQNSPKTLLKVALNFLIQHTQCQIGGIYYLQREVGKSPLIKLGALHGIPYRKYIHQELKPGEGLLGQMFKEGQSQIVQDIPENYYEFSSSLGKSPVENLILVPGIWNEKVECLLELASFQPFTENQISFLEKSGELIAASLVAVQGKLAA